MDKTWLQFDNGRNVTSLAPSWPALICDDVDVAAAVFAVAAAVG